MRWFRVAPKATWSGLDLCLAQQQFRLRSMLWLYEFWRVILLAVVLMKESQVCFVVGPLGFVKYLGKMRWP